MSVVRYYEVEGTYLGSRNSFIRVPAFVILGQDRIGQWTLLHKSGR